MTRKERRYIAAERKAKGLPPLKPHAYRFLSLDAELAAKHGIPLEVVRDIIGRTLGLLTTERLRVAGHCGIIVDSSD